MKVWKGEGRVALNAIVFTQQGGARARQRYADHLQEVTSVEGHKQLL